MTSDSIIIACTSCGTRNRIPRTKIKQKPVCAKCRESLANIPWFPVNINDSQFDAAVLKHHGIVMVDCWAPWCGPCKSMGPMLDGLAADYAGRVKVVKINMDENPATGSRYNVRSIPTLLFFKGGQLKDTLVGAVPRMEMESRLKPLL